MIKKAMRYCCITRINRSESEDILLPSDNISIKDEAVSASITELLILSEKYYESALHGIKYIPIQSRFSILLALRLYQAIGKKLTRNKITGEM